MICKYGFLKIKLDWKLTYSERERNKYLAKMRSVYVDVYGQD